MLNIFQYVAHSCSKCISKMELASHLHTWYLCKIKMSLRVWHSPIWIHKRFHKALRLQDCFPSFCWRLQHIQCTYLIKTTMLKISSSVSILGFLIFLILCVGVFLKILYQTASIFLCPQIHCFVCFLFKHGAAKCTIYRTVCRVIVKRNGNSHRAALSYMWSHRLQISL